ncbi:hypothetical protein V5O48_010599 [Marasmius crinis-equi]|uniref:Uncharacterized protein n=1 Tax=Marasmius crinis-equi TaxID=585013 RepID=A0ABR3F7X6_9AGAR
MSHTSYFANSYGFIIEGGNFASVYGNQIINNIQRIYHGSGKKDRTEYDDVRDSFVVGRRFFDQGVSSTTLLAGIFSGQKTSVYTNIQGGWIVEINTGQVAKRGCSEPTGRFVRPK